MRVNGGLLAEDDPALLRVCRDCGESKPEEEFYRVGGQWTGLRRECKVCTARDLAKRMEVRREADPEAFMAWRREIGRRSSRKKLGLTDEDVARMIEEAESACQICGKAVRDEAPTRSERLVVDHDHATGLVRGILCEPCNVGLARFSDNPAVLVAAANYLLSQTEKEGSSHSCE